MPGIYVQTNVTPENIKQRVTQDTLAVTAQAPATGDGYVKIALDLRTQITRIISTGCVSQDPGFLLTAQNKLFILARYLFGNSAIKLTDQAIVAQPALHVQPVGNNSGDEPTGIFVYNGGGIENHKLYQNAVGDQWRIWDIGTSAELWPEIKYNSGEQTLTNPQEDLIVYDERGRNAIGVAQNSGVGLEPIYVDTAASPTDVLVQGSGSDIEYIPFNPTAQQNNPLNQFWLQAYYNENSALPVYERLEHNAGGGQVPFPIPVALFTTTLEGVQKLLGYFVVRPNVNAAADGEPLRDDGTKLIADLADNDVIGVDPTFAPTSLTRL